jgi:prophage DNA circulation protein
MSWDNTLLPASFRGIQFEVISTGDDIERAVVAHEYPYVDGANVEDLGRNARRISITAVFFGDDYEVQLQQLMGALDQPGAGELIHPVFGSINAQFVRSNIPHEAALPDQTHVTLEFLESRVAAPLFDRMLPLQQVEAVNMAADAVLDAASARFAADIARAQNLPALLRDQLSSDLVGALDKMRGYSDLALAARNAVSSGAYYLSNPTSFVDELSGGLVSRVKALMSPVDLLVNYAGAGASGAASGYMRGGLGTVWTVPRDNLQQPLLVVSDRRAATPPQPFLVAHVDLQVAIAVASCAAAVFGKGLDDAVMTPGDIENIAGDTRTILAGVIDKIRTTFPDIVESRPLTEALKALALAVTDAAEKLISLHPPLTTRVVDTPGNLQLLAHLWYGDFHRADELLRLNPEVRNPNMVAGGTTLRCYTA